ncbi:uncharacterized protein [Argopecten irradians]|uniref:uncharacterized protein n=1 Tax=Argopecten irradians TaxID=31199 RepID=UPI0037208B17
MPKSMYQETIGVLLSDENTYNLLKKDHTARYTNKLVQLLRSLKDQGLLTIDQYRYLYPRSTDVSKFYGLPKYNLSSDEFPALFTSIPVQESVRIIRQTLEVDQTLAERTILSPQQITDLLEVCLSTTYSVVDGKFYQQTEGAAMGSLVSPIVANLFMEHF